MDINKRLKFEITVECDGVFEVIELEDGDVDTYRKTSDIWEHKEECKRNIVDCVIKFRDIKLKKDDKIWLSEFAEMFTGLQLLDPLIDASVWLSCVISNIWDFKKLKTLCEELRPMNVEELDNVFKAYKKTRYPWHERRDPLEGYEEETAKVLEHERRNKTIKKSMDDLISACLTVREDENGVNVLYISPSKSYRAFDKILHETGFLNSKSFMLEYKDEENEGKRLSFRYVQGSVPKTYYIEMVDVELNGECFSQRSSSKHK